MYEGGNLLTGKNHSIIKKNLFITFKYKILLKRYHIIPPYPPTQAVRVLVHGMGTLLS